MHCNFLPTHKLRESTDWKTASPSDKLQQSSSFLVIQLSDKLKGNRTTDQLYQIKQKEQIIRGFKKMHEI